MVLVILLVLRLASCCGHIGVYIHGTLEPVCPRSTARVLERLLFGRPSSFSDLSLDDIRGFLLKTQREQERERERCLNSEKGRRFKTEKKRRNRRRKKNETVNTAEPHSGGGRIFSRYRRFSRLLRCNSLLLLAGWWLLRPARAAEQRASRIRSTMTWWEHRHRPRGDCRQSAKGHWLGE